MSNTMGGCPDDPAAGVLHRLQTSEGRRILALLDGKTGAVPENRRGIDDEIAFEHGGRPFFTDDHADFSISHSGRMVAVAYVREDGCGTPPPRPLPRTGCDVQQVDTRRNRDEIAKRFYHAEERRYMEAAPSPPERNLRFFRLWVLKEAYLKMKGFSVGDIVKTPVFFPDGETPAFRAAKDAEAKNPAFFLTEWSGEPFHTYIHAVCLEEAGRDTGPPETRWFSGERLPDSSWLPVTPVL